MNVNERQTEPGFRFLDGPNAKPKVPRPRPRAVTEEPPRPLADEAPRPANTAPLAQALPSVDAALVMLRLMVRARPWLTIAIGAAMGLAIAGGLATRGGRAVLVTCGRYALRNLLSRTWQTATRRGPRGVS